MKNIVIIYELLQRKKAMIGFELNSQTSMTVNHVGASSETHRRFCTIDGDTFGGDYGILRFTAKNCLRFNAIYTKKEWYDQAK